jgi:hypothetical protein
MNRHQIFGRIDHERDRQEQLKAEGRFDHTLADDIPGPDKLTIMAEEFGEVAGATVQLSGLSNDRQTTRDDLKKELIQLAATCVAWLEALE